MSKLFPTLVIPDYRTVGDNAPVLSQVDDAFRNIADEMMKYKNARCDQWGDPPQRVHLLVSTSGRLLDCTWGSQNFFEDRLATILAERGITSSISNPHGHAGARDLESLNETYGMISFLSSRRPDGLWVAYQLGPGYNCF